VRREFPTARARAARARAARARAARAGRRTPRACTVVALLEGPENDGPCKGSARCTSRERRVFRALAAVGQRTPVFPTCGPPPFLSLGERMAEPSPWRGRSQVSGGACHNNARANGRRGALGLGRAASTARIDGPVFQCSRHDRSFLCADVVRLVIRPIPGMAPTPAVSYGGARRENRRGDSGKSTLIENAVNSPNTTA
jgi:hypothetical protein